MNHERISDAVRMMLMMMDWGVGEAQYITVTGSGNITVEWK